MHKQINFPDREAKLSSAAGVSVLELLIVMMVVGGLSTLAVMSFQRSSRSFRLSGATRSLTAYLEKTRVDAVRRHVTDNSARVDINSATSYTVNMDFSGTGTSTFRTINLPTGTTLAYTLPPATASIDPSVTPITIQYNWRGQTASTVLLTLTDATAGVAPSTIAVGPAGNLSTDRTVTGPVTTPTPQNTTETTATGIKSMQY
jgi:Tfp pilus assembly protein FimT